MPVTSIPCLQYKREKERLAKEKAGVVNEQDVNPVQSNNQECQPIASTSNNQGNNEQTKIDGSQSNGAYQQHAETSNKENSEIGKKDTKNIRDGNEEETQMKSGVSSTSQVPNGKSGPDTKSHPDPGQDVSNRVHINKDESLGKLYISVNRIIVGLYSNWL